MFLNEFISLYPLSKGYLHVKAYCPLVWKALPYESLALRPAVGTGMIQLSSSQGVWRRRHSRVVPAWCGSSGLGRVVGCREWAWWVTQAKQGVKQSTLKVRSSGLSGEISVRLSWSLDTLAANVGWLCLSLATRWPCPAGTGGWALWNHLGHCGVRI